MYGIYHTHALALGFFLSLYLHYTTMTDSHQPTLDQVLSDSNPQTSLDQNKDQQIAAILVVGFHHAFGPIVEFCVPPLPYHEQGKTQQALEKLELPEEWSFLPFLALPGECIKMRGLHPRVFAQQNMIDGAHQKDEDFAYFHLPPVPGWSVAETTLFGISCNRQIASKVSIHTACKRQGRLIMMH